MGMASNFVGELLGTFILVFFGCGAVASATLFAANTSLFQVAGIWGIGVTLAIYASLHLSCAHLNPAVSIAMAVAGRMVTKKLPLYLAAQFLGAFLAGGVLLLVFSDSIRHFESFHHIIRGSAESVKTASLFGEYFPSPSAPAAVGQITQTIAVLVEAVGTFLTGRVVISVVVQRGHQPADESAQDHLYLRRETLESTIASFSVGLFARSSIMTVKENPASALAKKKADELVRSLLELSSEGILIADTKKAMQEVRSRGIHPFLITSDKKGAGYLKEISPQTQSIILPRVESLPILLPALYKRLTA